MTWLWITLGLFSGFMVFIFLGAYRLAAETDKRMRLAFEIMMESRSQKADGLSCMKAGNADEA